MAIIIALATLAAYTVFSGPTTVPAPPTATEATPGKAPPAGEQEPNEPEGGSGR